MSAGANHSCPWAATSFLEEVWTWKQRAKSWSLEADRHLLSGRVALTRNRSHAERAAELLKRVTTNRRKTNA